LFKVGLQVGNVVTFIVIEARSVAGNRKACQTACEKLSQQASKLFGVSFDCLSLTVEEVVNELESPGQPEQEEQASKVL
jgi:hypothetical protein